jgi:hypothetical protein
MGIARDLTQIAAGPLLGPLINALGARKVHRWVMLNLDSGETLEGQFGPVNPVVSPGNPQYAEHTSLGRQNPIIQFTHVTADRLSFTALWFAVSDNDDTPEKAIQVLKNWKDRDPDLARPPRVGFSVGDGQLSMLSAVIESLGDISYFDPPKFGGGVRGVSVPVTLKEYTKFELISEPAPETRYHHAKQGEYYELISYFEYRTPDFGDIIRKRHPTKASLTENDVVKLPSAEAIRTIPIRPTSIAFRNTLLLKDSPQKQLRNRVFDRTNRAYTSPILPAGL